MQFYAEEQWLQWIDSLAADNYMVIDDFFPENQYQQLFNFFNQQKEAAQFEKAGIGLGDGNIVKTEIRGDFTYWLNAKKDSEIQFFFEWVQEFIGLLNRYCYLSLSGSEFHLAHYPIGSFYKKHLDQFKARNNRVITILLYLNPLWQNGDGGELRIDTNDGSMQTIAPLGNRLVVFKSAEIPHEVLPTKINRYSLTGWLLYQPRDVGFLTLGA